MKIIAQPTKVVLDSVQSNAAIKDLIKGKYAIEENLILESQLLNLKEKDLERVKDSIKQEQQKRELQLAFSAKSDEATLWKQAHENGQKIIKKLGAENWFWKAMIPVTAIATYFLAK